MGVHLGVWGFMPSHSLHSREHVKCSWVCLLARNLATPYFGREPKARVATYKLSMKLDWLMCYHLWHELWAMAYGFQLTSWCNNKIEIWLIFQCMFKFWCCFDPNELPFVSMIHIFLDMVNLQPTFFWAFRICFYIKHEKLMFLFVLGFNSPI